MEKQPEKKKRMRRFILPALALLIVLAFWPFPVVRAYRVQSARIERRIRVAVLSDLHSTSYGKNQGGIMRWLSVMQPDIVLLCGDIFDEKADQAPAKKLLTQLEETYDDCFYVTGNHEFWSGNAREIKSIVRDAGIPVLEGGFREVGAHNQTINICGTDDPEVDEEAFYRQLKKAARCDHNKFSILLTHRPELISEYLAYDFDLILTGHTHGGIWRLPPLINGIYAPNQGFFPRYAGGRYRFDDADMIVSRGLDRFMMVPRIFNPPEIVIVDIV